MDIPSQGLWGGIALGRASRKCFWTAFGFGLAPDFSSFGLVFTSGLLTHGMDFFNGMRHPPDPALFGAVLGAVNLLLFPAYLVPPPWRVVNLFLTPIAVGGLMMAMGRWRAKRGEEVVRIDRFLYGFLFAAALALVRYVLAG